MNTVITPMFRFLLITIKMCEKNEIPKSHSPKRGGGEGNGAAKRRRVRYVIRAAKRRRVRYVIRAASDAPSNVIAYAPPSVIMRAHRAPPKTLSRMRVITPPIPSFELFGI